MIYTLGLIFAILIILVSWDDFFWDLFYLYLRAFGKVEKNKTISLEVVESSPPKMMALIIAAYHEEDVIEDVIENLMRSTQYPVSMFHLFVGVYPNDPATTNIIKKLEKKYPNIHAVTHILNGPSSKADNINNVIKNIKSFEEDHSLRFQFIVIHDSEDVIHPYEFLFESYLMNKHQVIQMPVFPLIEKPRWRNIFKNMITSTYLDEFAENHYRMMPIRNSLNVFVPSAGTGFSIRRDVIDLYPDSNIFPVGSLTEDYKLSLQFKQRGIDLYYPLESVSKLNSEGKVVKEYVATRSMFPKTYKTAVRQKARWIHGITMQSFKMWDILKFKNLNFITRYSFYKDWKAKFSNLLILPSYIIFTYFLASLIFDIPVMYPKGTISWYIMISLTVLMLQRQFLRFRAVYKVYGVRSAAVAVLFPPLMPIRMILGNIINLHATLRAWKHHLFGVKKHKEKKTKEKKIKVVKWSKTDHEFLSPNILLRYHRSLEDKLLDRHLINYDDLMEYKNQAIKENKLLRLVLNEHNAIDEEALLKAVCQVESTQYYSGNLGNYILDENMDDFDPLELERLKVLPLFVYDNFILFIGLVDTNWDDVAKAFPNKVCRKVFTTKKQFSVYSHGEEVDEEIKRKLSVLLFCFSNEKVLVRQALIGMRYSDNLNNLLDVFKEMGLMACESNYLLQ